MYSMKTGDGCFIAIWNNMHSLTITTPQNLVCWHPPDFILSGKNTSKRCKGRGEHCSPRPQPSHTSVYIPSKWIGILKLKELTTLLVTQSVTLGTGLNMEHNLCGRSWRLRFVKCKCAWFVYPSTQQHITWCVCQRHSAASQTNTIRHRQTRHSNPTLWTYQVWSSSKRR